jgi:hypothetical protein
MVTVRKTGDWSKVSIALQSLQKLRPTFIAQMQDDSEFVLNKVQGHIDSQDLGWTPLADSTVALKNGDSTIYVETGFLRNNLKAQKVQSSSTSVTFYIGVDASATTPSGESLGDIMIWLEYGTRSIPARPLIRPTFDEVKDILEKHWTDLLKVILR